MALVPPSRRDYGRVRALFCKGWCRFLVEKVVWFKTVNLV
jgi:hypothetical protein